MSKKFPILIAFLLVSSIVYSQKTTNTDNTVYKRGKRSSFKDSLYQVPLIGLHLSGQIPVGDMASRFGTNLNAGMPLLFKTHKNLLIGVEGNYFFSGNVKENPLNYMFTSGNTITDANGNPGHLRFNERGFTDYTVIGKVFNKYGSNKNSGIVTWFGLGYMQHKIHIYDVGRSLAQITGDLVKGYDRLTGGVAIEQFIGYMYMAKNRLANCYGGFEFQEGFTSGLRGYQYDTMQSDSKRRIDVLIGFRIGWFLPLYKKTPKEFYYY